MNQLQNLWIAIKAFMTAYKLWGVLQLFIPIALTAWTVVVAIAETLPTAVVVALAVIVMSQSVLLLAGLNYVVGRPVTTINIQKLRAALNFDGVGVAYSPPGSHDPSLQLSLLLKNSSTQPLIYLVERFDFVVGNFTLQNKALSNRELLIPVFNSRQYIDHPIRGDAIQQLSGKKHEGSLEVYALYKRYDDPKFVRRYKLKLHLTIDLTFGQAKVRDLIESELDEPA